MELSKVDWDKVIAGFMDAVGPYYSESKKRASSEKLLGKFVSLWHLASYDECDGGIPSPDTWLQAYSSSRPWELQAYFKDESIPKAFRIVAEAIHLAFDQINILVSNHKGNEKPLSDFPEEWDEMLYLSLQIRELILELEEAMQ